MSSGNVEDRLVQLEQKVRRLEDESRPENKTAPWWERIAGAFKNDPIYAEAMKLGLEERKADRAEDSSE